MRYCSAVSLALLNVSFCLSIFATILGCIISTCPCSLSYCLFNPCIVVIACIRFFRPFIGNKMGQSNKLDSRLELSGSTVVVEVAARRKIASKSLSYTRLTLAINIS